MIAIAMGVSIAEIYVTMVTMAVVFLQFKYSWKKKKKRKSVDSTFAIEYIG